MQFDELMVEAIGEQASISRLSDRVARFLTQSAFQEFPALKNMEAQQIRDFGDAVSLAAFKFARQASHLACVAERVGDSDVKQ